MIDKIKTTLKNKLEEYYKKTYNTDISIIVEEPKNASLGDISIPAFSVVKILRKPMPEVVNEMIIEIKKASEYIKDVVTAGAFINIILNKEAIGSLTVADVLDKLGDYGNGNIGINKTMVIDYSAPNIAKSFSIGHLRSTMIGNSLKLILNKSGYKVVGINYLGDWGTQFGKMIVAYKKWGDIKEIEIDPINALTKLYVKFHDEAEKNPSLEDEAREAFRNMELGDPEYLKLWKYIREESLKESEQIYDLLEIKFDSYNGEAYYNDKMEPVVEELTDKKLLVLDEGALIVQLGDDVPPALIKRKDGGSLYITRDLAAVFDRKNTYNFYKALYVVGNEQKLHFSQLKSVITKMGYDFADDIVHVGFGLYLKDGKKMSTRKGKVVKLYDVLMTAIDLAYKQINEKNPDLKNKDEIAKKVGIAAVVFGDLKNHRSLDIEFDLEQSVQFEGQTGPYLQYTSVRIASILKDAKYDSLNIDKSLYEKAHYFELVKLISSFPQAIERAADEYAPSIVARHLLSIAQSFNKFYSIEKINSDDEKTRNTNMSLALAVRTILNEGLRLLGIHYLDEM